LLLTSNHAWSYCPTAAVGRMVFFALAPSELTSVCLIAVEPGAELAGEKIAIWAGRCCVEVSSGYRLRE
jgi:hypothetical protein